MDSDKLSNLLEPELSLQSSASGHRTLSQLIPGDWLPHEKGDLEEIDVE